MANAKPIAEVRIGNIKAAIWKNEAGNSTRHNVTFQRLYKDGIVEIHSDLRSR